MKYSEYIISDALSIIETVEVLNKTTAKVLFVLDSNRVLVGSITDGDVRRAVLRGFKPDDSNATIMNPSPIIFKVGGSKHKLLSIFETSHVSLIPIVDEERRVIDIVSNEQTYETRWRDIVVVVMAGGLGKRLKPLTDKVPKPMLKIGGVPILHRSLEHFKYLGFENFIFSLNYKGSIIKEYFRGGESFGVNISYVEESSPMGTGGSLGLINRAELSDNFLVVNGDVLTKLDFRKMLDFHCGECAAATMGVREFTVDIPYGVVKSEDGIFSELIEKPSKTYFINAGIYGLNTTVLSRIKSGDFFDLPDLFPILRKSRKKCVIFPISETWRDIGSPEEYRKAQIDER